MSDKLFWLKVNPEGVFLVVSPEAKGRLSLESVLSYIKEREIVDYDISAIKKAIEEAKGEPVKIAERRPELDRPAEIWVTMSEDKMKAYIEVKPPLGKPWPTFEELMAELRDNGVVFGIKEDVVREIAEKKIANKRILVAEGRYPIDGEDAKIVFKVDVFRDLKPKVDEESGRADLKDLGAVLNVVAGQELAEKIPPKPGKDGMNVCGQIVRAKTPKDVPLPLGKNVIVSDDKKRLFAAIDGHVVYENGRLHVLPIFEVKGDVEYSTGNINFVGAVIVKGSVKSGFEVRSGGDVEISGVVEEGSIYSFGSITIRGGIRGGGKSYIESKDDIAVKFIEQAKVKCGGSLYVTGPIMHSEVSVRNEILCEGSKGMIVGGRVRAGKLIRCKALGSEVGTKTEVEVGVDPEIIEELQKLKEAKQGAEEKLKEVNKGVDYLKKLDKAGSLDNKKRMTLVKLVRMQFQLKGQLEAINSRITEIEEEMKECKEVAKIMVKGEVYPGVVITIRGVSYKVKEAIKYATFYYEDGEVKFKPYS